MYDQFASDYDRFVNWQNRLDLEIPFIEKLLQGVKTPDKKPIKVLDAACGTGMHALTLAKAGYEVVGADLSSEMIAKARSNALKMGIQVRFEEVGFGSLTNHFGQEQFDALLCLGNSLPHLLSRDDLQAALVDFASCLRPGGLLLIQNRNFDQVMSTQNRWMEPQEYQEGEDQWVYLRFYDFNPDGTIQFNITTLQRSSHEPWSSNVVSTLLRPILHEDLLSILKTTCFSEMHAYGSLSGDDFNPNTSGNLVFSALKK